MRAGGSRWALGTQSRHRWWAGLSFCLPVQVEGGREARAGRHPRGGGGRASVVLPCGGGGVRGGGKTPAPVSLVPYGGPAHGLHPRFVP